MVKTIKRICRQCGTAFYRPECATRHRAIIFCSATCRDLDKSNVLKLWDYVERAGDDDCWEWRGALSTGGYGIFSRGGFHYAHRAAYALTYGPIPKGMCVLHKCDNRKCVNPSHLFLGTQLDNIKDMRDKNRHAHGESASYSKLNESMIREARQLNKDGRSLRGIAKEFGVNGSTLHQAVRGKRNWRHIAE